MCFFPESKLPTWSKSVIILHRQHWQGQPRYTPDKTLIQTYPMRLLTHSISR